MLCETKMDTDNSNTVQVFVYGTLLPGQSNHVVAAPFVRAAMPGRIKGRLVDCGAYPAAVRDDESISRNCIIRGVWLVVDIAGLAAMDELEEFYGIEEINDYERIWVTDADDTQLAGWAYVWGEDRGYPAIEHDYWPDYLAAQKITKNNWL